MKETTRKVEQNLLKKEQGITLVALVVTIIALLIISAVAISFGVEGGVVDQAITAEEETIIGEEKEKILLAYQGAELDYQIEKNGLTLKDFETNLAPYIEEGTVELEAVSKSDIPEGANILVERNNPTAEYAKVTYIETGHIYYVELIPEYVDPDAETYEIKYISEKSDGTEETVTHVKQEGAPYEVQHISNVDGLTSSKQGYTFGGWSTSKGGTSQYAPGSVYNDNSSLTLYAVWIADYTITYDANGGENAPEEGKKPHEMSYNISSEKPTRTGYSFAGWSTTRNGSIEYTGGETYETNADLTLYAVWNQDAVITYNPNGGTGNEVTENKKYGETYTIAENTFIRENYIFEGWSTTDTGTVEYTVGQEYTENSSLTLYAVWKEELKVTYNPNGGDGEVVVENKNYDETYTIAGNTFTRENYIFDGWSTTDTGTVEYTVGQEYTENSSLTLYAVWKEELKVTYNPNGGDGEVVVENKNYGETYTISSTIPTRAGFDFTGWSTSATGAVEYTAGQEYTEDSSLTLYAVWGTQEYVITYDANGGENAPASVIKESDVTYIITSDEPTYSGFAFLGWSETSDGSVTYVAGDEYTENSSLTLYAVWSEQYYLVDGTTYAPTLEQALAIANQTGSTIEVLRNVTDKSQVINVGKEVTLNLGEFRITLDKTITIAEAGNLTILGVQGNGQNAAIENNTGVAIENNGILNIGQDDGNLSSYAPRISGTTRGLVTTSGTTYFNDGEIEGDTAIEGDVIVPDTLAARSTVDGTREIVRISSLGDAVARVGYNYFSTIQAAVDSIEEGIEGDIERTITTIPSLKNDDYGFEYIDGKLVSETITELGNVAHACIEIDLTEYSSDEECTLKVNLTSPYSYRNSKSIYVDDTSSENRLLSSYSNFSDYNVSKILTGGEVYYLHLKYSKIQENNVENNGLTINSISINEENINLNEMTIIKETINQKSSSDVPQVIKLLTNVSTVTQENLNINSKNIIIDLDGKQLELNSSIINEGKLEIIDSSIQKLGTVQFTESGTSSQYKVGILNKGELKISVDLEAVAEYFIVIKNEEMSKFYLEDGNSISSTATYGNILRNYGNSNVKLVGENINIIQQGTSAIYSSGKTNLEIIGCNVSAKTKDILNVGNVTVKVSNIEIGEIYNSVNSKLELNGQNSVNNIYNSDNTILNIYGDIVSQGSIYNEDSVEINISGNLISSSECAIHNEDYAKINFIEGIVQGNNNGIKMNINSELIIGTKDSQIELNTLQIVGVQGIGIDNSLNGKIYFYGGIIKGKEMSIEGTITDVEDNYTVIKKLDEQNDNIAYLGIDEIAQIGETKFESLVAAVESVGENVTEEITIQMIQNSINLHEINFGDKRIIIDLNGKKIESYESLLNQNELKIIDTSIDKSGEIEFVKIGKSLSEQSSGIINTGTLEISTKVKMETMYTRVIVNEGTGNIKIKEGSEIIGAGYGIYSKSTGTIELLGGIIDINVDSSEFKIAASYLRSSGIYNGDEGTIVISSGTIRCQNTTIDSKDEDLYAYGIFNAANGKVEFIDGNIEIINSTQGSTKYDYDDLNSYGIYNYSTGEIKILNGNIQVNEIYNKNYDDIRSYAIYNYQTANVEINGGIIDGTEYGIYNYGGGSIKINGGTISCGNISSITEYAIYNRSIGTIEMSGGIIKNTQYGVFSEGTNVIIKGGEINNVSYAVHNEKSGNILIEMLNINDAYVGIQNMAGGSIDIKNIEIKAISSSSTGVLNNSTGIINMLNGNIDVRTTGIDNKTTGTVNIVNGKIIGLYAGINNRATGIVNIGTQNIEGIGEVNIETPEIKSDQYGVYNSNLGVINFYDGIIKGKDDTISGTVTNIEENYSIIKGTDEEYKYMHLGEVFPVQIGEIKYKSLDEAIATIQEGKQEYTTITMIENQVDLKVDDLVLGNRKIILDLNGKVLEVSRKIIKTTDLIITDTSLEKTGELISNGSGANEYNLFVGIQNLGTLEIKTKVTLNNSYGALIKNEENSQVSITSGGVLSVGGYYTYAIYNTAGTVIVDDGDIESGWWSIHNESGIVDISDAIVNGELVSNAGTINIMNSIVHRISNQSGELNIGTGELYLIYSSGGTVNLNGATVQQIYNYDGIMNFSLGTITTSLQNTGDSILNMTGGSIETGGITNNKEGIINVLGGTINGNVGITNKGGIVNIGKKNTEEEHGVNIENPSIQGYKYGIENSGGTLNFYDGIIKGRTQSISGPVASIEDGYNIINSELDGYKQSYLGESYAVEVGNVRFKTMELAINSIEEGNTEFETMRVIEDIVDIEEGEIDFGNRKIILDLNGYTVSYAKTYINTSEMQIIDLSLEKTGELMFNKLGTSQEIFVGIKNTGILNISTTINMLNEYNTAIRNEGTGSVEIKENSKITSKGYIIQNEDSGNVSVKETTLENTGDYINNSIYNNSTGTVEIVGGSIKGVGDRAVTAISNNADGSIVTNGVRIDIISHYKAIGIANYSINKIDINDTEIKIYLYGGSNTVIDATGIDNDIGEVNITNGKIEIFAAENCYAINNDIGRITVNGTELDVESVSSIKQGITSSYGVYNGGTIDINDIKIVATSDTSTDSIRHYSYGIYNKQGGTLNFESGTIKSENKKNTGYAIYNKGNLEYEGGTMTDSNSGIYNVESGIANLSGGIIDSTIYNGYGAQINILDNALINSKITNNGNSIVNISGGVVDLVKEESSQVNTAAIINEGEGTINISGGIVRNEGNEFDHGVHNYTTGTVNIRGGNIECSGIAVYNEETGNIKIGTSGGEINKKSPIISGDIYAVSNLNGILQFYDGIIKGKTNTYHGEITEIESGYQLREEIVGEYEEGTLVPVGGEIFVASIGSVNYTSLQDAIFASIEGDTILLLEDIILDNGTLGIDADKKVKINLNGNKITADSVGTIINAGELQLVDTSTAGTGSVENTVGVAITNTGKLTLGEDDGTVNVNAPQIIGTTKGIESTGTIFFYDGFVKGNIAIEGNVDGIVAGYTIVETDEDGKKKKTLQN